MCTLLHCTTVQDVMRKYKGSVAAVSTDQITIQDQAASLQLLEQERNKLREQVAELSQRLLHLDGENVSTAQHKRLELKVRELESKLELERTGKGRLEVQIQRQREALDKLSREGEELRAREAAGTEENRKVARQLRSVISSPGLSLAETERQMIMLNLLLEVNGQSELSYSICC